MDNPTVQSRKKGSDAASAHDSNPRIRIDGESTRMAILQSAREQKEIPLKNQIALPAR